MPALAFDTHAAIIEARMATKQDLELQKVEILRDIAEVKRDIKGLDARAMSGR